MPGALNQEAEHAAGRMTAGIGDQIGAIGGGLRDPAAIEREGRRRLVELVHAAVEQWRAERRRGLEDGLPVLDPCLAESLRRELAGVRDGAAALLEVDLAVPVEEGRLVEDPRFFYVLADQAGQTELPAGAVRRRLPGEFGRRRAREHLRREVAELVPKQVGRARADLQCRLGEATRALARDRPPLRRVRRPSGRRPGPAVTATAGGDGQAREDEPAVRESALNDLMARLASPDLLSPTASR